MTSNPKPHSAFVLMLLLAVLVSIPACSRKNRPEEKPLRNRSSNNILNRYNDHIFEFEYLSMRVSADVKSPEESQSFKANIRAAKDSLIWISVTPLMGVEMIRLLMTPDSVKYVSKVPNNKHYFLGTFKELSNITQTELDFQSIQAILTGNLVQLDEENDRFASRIEGRNYVLLSRYNRKLKRVLGSDLKELSAEDSLEVDSELKDRRYQRIIRRSDEEDLLMKRYWISGDDFRPTKTVFDDLYYKRYLQIEHSGYKTLDDQKYPGKTVVTAGSPEGNIRFTIETNRIKLYDELDFPFDIPDDYERKNLP